MNKYRRDDFKFKECRGGSPKLETCCAMCATLGLGEAIQRALLAGKGSHADQLLQVADEFLS